MRCKVLILVIAFLIPFFAGSPSSHAEDSSDPLAKAIEEIEPKIIVKVNGSPINELDLESEINTIMPGQIVHGSIPGKKIERVRAKALKRLIDERLSS